MRKFITSTAISMFVLTLSGGHFTSTSQTAKPALMQIAMGGASDTVIR
jgi:hypothetical protein